MMFSNKVGTISANGEREIGELIAKGMEKVGKEGVITIAVSCIRSSSLFTCIIVDAYHMESGRFFMFHMH